MTLTELAARIARENEAKGYEITPENLHAKLLLVVSEVCEAQEVVRDGYPLGDLWLGEDDKPEGFPVELADALIRLLHLLHWVLEHGPLTIDTIVDLKLRYNVSRPMRGF